MVGKTNAAIINSWVLPSFGLLHPVHLSPHNSLAGHGHCLACLPIALPNYSFRAEWSKFNGVQARVCYAESTPTRLTHLIRRTRLHRLARLASIWLCQSQTATCRVRRDCTTPSPNWIQRRPIGDATLRMRTLLREHFTTQNTRIKTRTLGHQNIRIHQNHQTHQSTRMHQTHQSIRIHQNH